ncbi:MAG: ATP-dependent zinc metalloprotease FtsH [Bacteroidetes bacterium]|nr:ATP-dependent zinc metalloprotease FtsH [Bacteroidota bacterium]
MENRQTNPGKPKDSKFNFYWVWGIIIVLILMAQFYNFGSSIKEISASQFFSKMLPNGDVAKVVVVNKEYVEVYIKESRIKTDSNYIKDLPKSKVAVPGQEGSHYRFSIGSLDIFETDLKNAQLQIPPANRISPVYEKRGTLWDVVGFILPFILLALVWMFLMRKVGGGAGGGGMGGQIFNIGKSKASLYEKGEKVSITFEDVAGLGQAKEEVKEVVDFLKNPKKYTMLGGKIPKGVLLVGPPGTGKTLLAKAVAGEAQVPFFSLSGSDFVEMFVGVGASRVRDLFKQAREKAPCIIFIDEIDAVGRARGKGMMQTNDERESTLNQLLVEMDGFSGDKNIILIAATNRPDVLDAALLRPGRFDRQIYVDLPDVNEREQIFNVHLKPLTLGPDIDVAFLAKQTPGFSGADIANICNEAALVAARKDKKFIEKQDFLDAIDRVVGGLEKKNKVIKPGEKKRIAYHEAGHATVSWLTEHASPLIKVTIVPRGQSLGAAWYLPEERSITTTQQILDEMCATLGGRASEEIVFGNISTGALSDLEKVTRQAQAIVKIYGLSDKIGNVSYYDSSGQQEYSFQKPYSEKTAELIDKEISDIIEKQYIRAKEILTLNREKLDDLSKILLEKEVIFRDDLEVILGKRPNEEDEIVEPKAELLANDEEPIITEEPII